MTIMTGCAGIKGFPEPSTSTEDSGAIINLYPKKDALRKFAGSDDGNRGMSREAWRNLVLEAYASAPHTSGKRPSAMSTKSDTDQPIGV
jgi:hypothetical protein